MLGWFFAFATVAALQLMASSVFVKPYDEGLILAGAAQVARGGVPYRDFWSMYGPGSFYALAGLDLVFGESAFVGRCFDAAARAGVVVMVLRLTWGRIGRIGAPIAALAAFALLAGVREYLFPALPAIALALVAMHAVERGLRRGVPAAPAAWALPGAAVGLTLLFRHDFGLLTALACLPALWLIDPSTAPARLAAFAAGIGLVAAPMVVVLVVQVPLRDLYENLVVFPLEVYVPNRALPFPSVVDVLREALASHAVRPAAVLLAYLPLLVAAVHLPIALHGVLERGTVSRRQRASRSISLGWALLNTLLCAKGLVRFELLHMLPALLVSIVVVTRGLGRQRARRGVGAALMTAGAVFASVVVALAGRALTSSREGLPPSAFVLTDWPSCDSTGLPRLGCFRMMDGREEVLLFLAKHAKPGDRLYVGTGRHDKLTINNVELYFFSGLSPATKWQDLHPGVQTTRAVQQRVVAELERNPPAFVVLNTEWDDRVEPNRSRIPSGVTLIDDHLRACCSPVYRVGTFTVSVQREPDTRTASRR